MSSSVALVRILNDLWSDCITFYIWDNIKLADFLVPISSKK